MSLVGVSSSGFIEDDRGRMTRGRLSGGYYYWRGLPVHRLVLNVFDAAGYHRVWLNVADHINRDRSFDAWEFGEQARLSII